MKQINFCASLGLMLGSLFCSLEGASEGRVYTTVTSAAQNPSTTQEKFNIMERDQNEDSDALAIPFDESEIEDEEQIDQDEDQDVFNLPHSR